MNHTNPAANIPSTKTLIAGIIETPIGDISCIGTIKDETENQSIDSINPTQVPVHSIHPSNSEKKLYMSLKGLELFDPSYNQFLKPAKIDPHTRMFVIPYAANPKNNSCCIN